MTDGHWAVDSKVEGPMAPAARNDQLDTQEGTPGGVPGRNHDPQRNHFPPVAYEIIGRSQFSDLDRNSNPAGDSMRPAGPGSSTSKALPGSPETICAAFVRHQRGLSRMTLGPRSDRRSTRSFASHLNPHRGNNTRV